MWHFETTDEYDRAAKWYEKKRTDELVAVLTNLHRLQEMLRLGGSLAKAKFGFFRSEGDRVYRISQQGQGGNLQETRLYTYPDEDARILHLLTIGDKASQKKDLAYCKAWVKKHRQGGQT